MKTVIEILRGELSCAKNSLETYVGQVENSKIILDRNKTRMEECEDKIIQLNQAISLIEENMGEK